MCPNGFLPSRARNSPRPLSRHPVPGQMHQPLVSSLDLILTHWLIATTISPRSGLARSSAHRRLPSPPCPSPRRSIPLAPSICRRASASPVRSSHISSPAGTCPPPLSMPAPVRSVFAGRPSTEPATTCTSESARRASIAAGLGPYPSHRPSLSRLALPNASTLRRHPPLGYTSWPAIPMHERRALRT